MTDNHEKIQLTRALKSRHIFMLSLGGVIGTGLFMGSGVTINQGGPVGAILAYLVAGLLMYLVMVCLGELSVQMPVSGSFQAHATKFIGPATASRIIQARGAGGFSSLQDLLDIPYFTERVLTPAASEIRDDFLQQREAAAAAGGADTTGN